MRFVPTLGKAMMRWERHDHVGAVNAAFIRNNRRGVLVDFFREQLFAEDFVIHRRAVQE